ncbi:MAG: SMR family transporter [Actinomycetota bacterium]|nr:SMR family transporter [Actinomycetota bacterium]
MAWIYLSIAGIFEIGFAMGLKYSEGFTRLWPTLVMVAAFRLVSILLIVVGIVGLRISSSG